MTISCNKEQKDSIIEHNTSVQYQLIKYTESEQHAWDEMIDNSVNGTLLHTRRFLSYHGQRFSDQSLFAFDEKGTLRAIFPAATDPTDGTIIVSHPGVTYGGLVHDGWLRGQRCIDLLKQLCKFYNSAGFKKLVYKAVPWIYHRMPAQDDIYALSYLKADRYRVDLSATIDIQNRGPISERRKRLLKKAANANLWISDSFENIEAYWNILAENLKTKHSKMPVHSVSELRLLIEKFPEHIDLITAVFNKEVLAGSLLFHCPTLIHGQYFASSTAGREAGALDLVIEHCLEEAKQLGKRYFDFGISTDEQGTYLNNSLHTFKCEFGGGASVYEFYKIKL